MPSSISSSDRPDLQRTRWAHTWALTALLVSALVLGWEGFWRQRGFTPSVLDDGTLWAFVRRQLENANRDDVVIIGSSRIQLGLNLDALAEVSGWPKPYQLAIAMGPTVPVLRHLALESNFSGLVIAEINERIFFAEQRSLDWVFAANARKYREFGFTKAVEHALSSRVQEAFVFRLPGLSPKQLLQALHSGLWPHPDRISVLRDRSRYARFELVPDLNQLIRRTARLREHSTTTFLSPEALAQWLEEVENLVSIIRARGGDVVMLRMPTSGLILANERETVPRALYWDVLASNTSALTVHFEDYPSLANFTAPDGGHLGHLDAVEFTRAFGEILTHAMASRSPE